ncbi:roadblock/LC7 domain-containing protein [Neptuniibacter sp. CAU 1671]|uniref:roadblock/LC7 domain-containing protein n=1 Tax=Neptuniibacter sp. CAU 1671 TaxID=3032593 RepID=UPI0023DA395C|nr:roadblock/LC7 domain-containing protein [Neptuniibacter sp. CAU 1671]MDF2181483.1 roadblock/LC7 domain-containing protein [Neptuniibacter sp. CAU 1671]
MRAEMLTSILRNLNGTSADIEACAVISIDGLMMAAQMPHGLDEDRVGAMSAAMLSLGERTAKELARGVMEQVLVKGDKGYILMTNASKDAVLTVVANANARLGLIFFDVRKAADEIGKVLV